MRIANDPKTGKVATIVIDSAELNEAVMMWIKMTTTKKLNLRVKRPSIVVEAFDGIKLQPLRVRLDWGA